MRFLSSERQVNFAHFGLVYPTCSQIIAEGSAAHSAGTFVVLNSNLRDSLAAVLCRRFHPRTPSVLSTNLPPPVLRPASDFRRSHTETEQGCWPSDHDLPRQARCV